MTAVDSIDPGERSGEHLSRLPRLADASIWISIDEEMQELKAAPAWQQPGGRSSATLVKHQDFRIVLTLMRGGARISDHRAGGSISIHAILGRIRLHLPGDQVYELTPGDVLALRANVGHDVEALEESAFLLTIAWPPGPEASQ